MIAANQEERRKMLSDLAVRGECWVDENGYRIEPGFASPEHERLVRNYERWKFAEGLGLDIDALATPIIYAKP